MREICETFRIESSRTQISFSEKYKKVHKMKIEKLVYKTASSGNYNMIVILGGWCSHRYNVNGTTFYTYLQNLPRVTLAEVDYEAPNDHWDEIKAIPSDLSTTNLEIYINGDSTNTDIDNSNPVYIEFKLLIDE